MIISNIQNQIDIFPNILLVEYSFGYSGDNMIDQLSCFRSTKYINKGFYIENHLLHDKIVTYFRDEHITYNRYNGNNIKENKYKSELIKVVQYDNRNKELYNIIIDNLNKKIHLNEYTLNFIKK